MAKSNAESIIEGGSDAVQLTVRGFTTQTTLPFVVENSEGTDVFTVSNAGNVVASGTLAVTGAATLTSTLAANGHITMADAKNIVLNATTGTKIGTATTQKLGLFNAEPVVQAAAPTAALTTLTAVAPGTPDYAIQDVINSSAYGFASAEEARTFISVVLNLNTRVGQLQTALANLGVTA